MAQASKKINGGKPLTPEDIQHIRIDRGNVTIVALSRLASEALGRDVSAWQMRAVIHRFPGVVYQDVREWLAGWIGCDVSQVGREPLPRKAPATETAEAA
jgi:hypothetical protein